MDETDLHQRENNSGAVGKRVLLVLSLDSGFVRFNLCFSVEESDIYFH